MLQTLAKHALAGAFDADEVAFWSTDAFEQAWKRVEENGSIRVGDGHAEATRELLALRIIEIAQLGERDPHRLRDDALASQLAGCGCGGTISSNPRFTCRS